MRFLMLFWLVSWSIKPFSASGQNNQLFSLKVTNIGFPQMATQIEQQTSYRFYFNPAQLDSFNVSAEVNQVRLEPFLDQLFAGTEFKWAISPGNEVFITYQFPIITQLPKHLLAKGNGPVSDSIPAWLRGSDSAQKGAWSNLMKESILIEIGKKVKGNESGMAVIEGKLRDLVTGEPIQGGVITAGKTTAVSNQFGQYTIRLPRGRLQLKVTSLGMRDTQRELLVHDNGVLYIDMDAYVETLKSVNIVASQRRSNIKSTQMGVEKLNIRLIKQVPVAFGEADILRTILALPGVTSVGEASTGFNVRGGSADQNLILLNDATIYNPAHFFGFFSAFNPNVVKGVELYKSSIPEKYGGRIASVLEVNLQEGNKKKFSGEGGIGPLTSQLMLEGPIVKDKSSFIIGGRTTYSDWLLKSLPDESFKNSQAGFYDVTLHLANQVNERNSFYVTGYLSQDRFRLNLDSNFNYSNKNINLNWKHIFKNGANGTFSTGYDAYDYGINSQQLSKDAFQLKFSINQYYAKADYTLAKGAKHRFNAGVNGILYQLKPGSFTPKGEESLVVPNILQNEQALETAVYLGDKILLGNNLAVEAGLRYSFYAALGPQTLNVYAPGLPREESNIINTERFDKGKTTQTYHGPEFRVTGRYTLPGDASVKVSFNTLRQYIHMLSNTTAISPTDIWKLSDPNIKPQTGQQVSLGYYKNFEDQALELSAEVYYKRLNNYLDYKSGAVLILNPHIETDVFSSRGKAYGIELMARKSTGKLNGWISYTYSRTLLQTNDPLAAVPVNSGDFYPANFDKPHNANLISNYRFSHRFSVSLNMVYSTGRPITLPVAIFSYAGGNRVFYSERNQYRIPDNFRADFSMSFEGNHKKKKWIHGSWSVGVYNLTARKNPYSVYFVTENGQIKGYQLSIFGTAIPFITYHFKF